MTTRTSHGPPFRAEQLGSLLRPQDLLAKRDDIDKGSATEKDLTPIEDRAIKTAVKQQLDMGYRGVTDGEYRRHMFWGNFFPNLHGMKEVHNPPISLFRPYVPDVAAFMQQNIKTGESVICVGKISHSGTSVNLPQFEYLKTLLPKEQWGDIKMTLPAPEWYHLRYKQGEAYSKDAYTNDADYFHDIAVAYRKELDILYKAGLRNVQIDDPIFAYFCSQQMLDGWKEDKSNICTTDELLDTYIKFHNECISAAPKDMHIGLHICRGNYANSRHFSEGGYDAIAKALFENLNVSTFYLEYDTPRAGTFAPLIHLPKSKEAILGVVTSKFPQLEDKDKMVERVREGAKYVAQGTGQSEAAAIQQLGVSAQCGFASHSKGNTLGYDDMLKKLELVRQVADEIWSGEA